MSDNVVKKPETRDELVTMLTEAARKSIEIQRISKLKPTVSATAETLNIHRDTLHTWLKEFNVDFKEVADTIPTQSEGETVGLSRTAYMIGEALVGEGNEVAHIDLLMGDKNGPVGEAFASGMSNL